MTKQEVIDLIKKMIDLNQREQAVATYTMANKTWPEWELKHSEELKALKS